VAPWLGEGTRKIGWAFMMLDEIYVTLFINEDIFSLKVETSGIT
jgi:hypothetical protein